MFKFIVIISLLIVLMSCQGLNSSPNDSPSSTFSKGTAFSNEQFGYQLYLPEIITESSSWLNGITGESGPSFGSDINYSIDPPFGRRSISVNVHPSAPSCTPYTTGITEEKVLEKVGDHTVWGKLDITLKQGVHTNIICSYPKIEECRKDKDYQTCLATNIGAYDFCSEEDDKRVVICISQQTDDPKMAEEIFKTFRWIDQEVRPQKKDEDVSPSFG